MKYWQVVATLMRKDLMIEARTRESLPTMVLFALSTLVVFHFALRRDTLEGELASGVLWVTLLFAAVIGINRLFASEREESRLDGLLLAPIDRTSVLIAKISSLMIYLFLLELVLIPAFMLLFNVDQAAADLPKLLLVVLLANLGLAGVGCLVSGLTIRARARELLLPLIMLPLMVPVILAASAATAPLLETGANSTLGKWLPLLALFDTVFLLLAFAVFDYVLED